MFEVEKINNVKVKPLIQHTKNQDEVLGGKLFLDPFSNCCIVAKKKSGKTTLFYNILKKVTRGGYYPSNVIIFCSTVFKDKTWEMIIKMLEKKGVLVSTYTNFIEDGENIVEELIHRLESKKEEVEGKKKEKIEPMNELMFGGGKTEEEKKPPPKPKKLCAEYVFVFDDLGSDLKHETIANLSKKIRHFGRCFISTQFITDITPATRKQMDYCIVFRSFNVEKLKTLYEAFDLSCDFDTFVDIYNFATEEPYNFLYIDIRENKFRKNFDKEIKI